MLALSQVHPAAPNPGRAPWPATPRPSPPAPRARPAAAAVGHRPAAGLAQPGRPGRLVPRPGRAPTCCADGHLLHTNHYSFTAPDHPWVNHEWLFEAAVAVTAPALPPAADAPLPGWSLLRLLLILALARCCSWATASWPGPRPPGRIALADRRRRPGRARPAVDPADPAARTGVLPAAGGAGAGGASAPWPPAGDPCPGAAWLDPRRAPGQALLATLLWAQVPRVRRPGARPCGCWAWPARVDRRPRAARRHRRPAAPWPGPPWPLVALALTPNGPAGLLLPLRALGQFRGDRPDLGGIISELVPSCRPATPWAPPCCVFKLSLRLEPAVGRDPVGPGAGAAGAAAGAGRRGGPGGPARPRPLRRGLRAAAHRHRLAPAPAPPAGAAAAAGPLGPALVGRGGLAAACAVWWPAHRLGPLLPGRGRGRAVSAPA